MKGVLFTYGMTLFGALAGLFYPFVGLLVYISFAILKPDGEQGMWYWSVPAGNYSRILAISFLVGWAARGFGAGRLGQAGAITGWLVAFVGWAALGGIGAFNPTQAWAFIESMAKILVAFLAGITLITSVKQLKQLAWVIVITQGYVAYEFNMAYLGGFNRVHEVGFGGMDNNSIAIGMVTCIGLAFFLGMGATRLWHKAVAFGCALLMVHVVLFSFSRGGMLALLITGGLGFFLTPRKPQHYLAFGLAVVVTLSLAGQEVTERFLSTFFNKEQRDESAQSRLDLWRDNWDVMVKNPLFGCGPHHWPLIAHEYGWNPGKEGHSLWLQVGAELGFPGLGFLVMFYVTCIRRLWRFTSQSYPVRDPFFRDVARMVIAALVGFAVSAQFVSLVGLEVPYYVVLLGAGALKLSSMPAGAPAREAARAAPAHSYAPVY